MNYKVNDMFGVVKNGLDKKEKVKSTSTFMSNYSKNNPQNKGILVKRGDYSKWIENWLKNETPILKELDKKGYALYLNKNGELVYYIKNNSSLELIPLTDRAGKRRLSNILQREIIVSYNNDNKNNINPIDLIGVDKEEFEPLQKQRFYKYSNYWCINTFNPTKYMNLTQPYNKEPVYIFKLISNLVNNDKERFDYFINWLAYYWQTFKKPQTAITLKGKQGTGKNIFAKLILGELFGKEYISIVTNKNIDTQFRKPLYYAKMFIIYDEVSKGDVRDNKEVKNFIKGVITNDDEMLEDKKEKMVKVKLLAPSIFFTNESKFLEIEPNDRRFSIFSTGEALHKINFLGAGNYEALAKHIKEEIADFAKYLYNYPVDVKKANKPLETPEKRFIIKATSNKYTELYYAVQEKDLSYFEYILEEGEIYRNLFEEIKADFEKNRFKRSNLKKVFNIIYGENISSNKLTKELKVIGNLLYNTKPIGGQYYIYF